MISTLRHDPGFPRDGADRVRRPVIIRVTEFDEDAVAKFTDDVNAAHETGQDILPVVIDSYGGEPYSLMSMIAILDSARLPVATIVEGKAMSCGAILFALGAQRFMAPNATLMFHDIAQTAYDDKKVADVRADADELQRLQDTLFIRMAEHVGKARSYFSALLDANKHADVYITAQQAKKQNIATHIAVPSFETVVSVTHHFGVDGSRKAAVSSYRKTQKPIHNAAARRSKGAH
jgi:ATP-dependent protease ClpP protease subunit